MPTDSINVSGSVGGVAIGGALTATAEHAANGAPSVAAAIEGTLTTRSTATTGVITLGSGHGITDSDTVDVYWTDGLQHDCAVTAYDSTTITIGSGTGDDLPDQDSTVKVGKVQTEDCADFAGSNVLMWFVMLTYRGYVRLQTSVPADVAVKEFTGSDPLLWVSGQLTTNPLAGSTIAQIQVSAGTTQADELKYGIRKTG